MVAWAGLATLSPSVAAFPTLLRPAPSNDPLSAREAEVLTLISWGMSNEHIARELQLGP